MLALLLLVLVGGAVAFVCYRARAGPPTPTRAGREEANRRFKELKTQNEAHLGARDAFIEQEY